MDNQNPPTTPAPVPNQGAPGNARQQVIERLKQANNVLVTVSANPSVDQLAAAIGLTLMLNKLNKHATAVFSGQVPSTIEFLKPEDTLEKTTDSLRDFIIALDKSKADKLRYKVEDKVVRIFITPYKTSISEKDLEFSQGDFNVDVVVALGVHQQTDLDQAITAHGRILHDATVTTISTTVASALGSINWQDASSSSLSELVASMSNELGNNLLDGQIATALLTGVVAETNRFSNNKTSPQTMSVSAQLMVAGANQQLIASKLEKPPEAPPTPAAKPPQNQPPPGPATVPKPVEPAKKEESKSGEGTLDIPHDEKNPKDDTTNEEEKNLLPNNQINIDKEGALHKLAEEQQTPAYAPTAESATTATGGSRMVMQPPTFGGTLSSETKPEPVDPYTDPMSLPNVPPDLLERDQGAGARGTSANNPTLSQIEDKVNAAGETGTHPNIDQLNAQAKAVASEGLPSPIAALGAQQGLSNLNSSLPSVTTTEQPQGTLDMPVPPADTLPMPGVNPPTGPSGSPPPSADDSPPPVPPPLPMPPAPGSST